MSNYAVAREVVPYRMLAGQPFGVGWALASEDGTASGTPLDVSAVTDIQVIATLRAPRGLTVPTPTLWTQSSAGGVTLGSQTLGVTAYPFVAVTGAAPAAGVYDVMLILITSAGEDWVLNSVFDVVAAA